MRHITCIMSESFLLHYGHVMQFPEDDLAHSIFIELCVSLGVVNWDPKVFRCVAGAAMCCASACYPTSDSGWMKLREQQHLQPAGISPLVFYLFTVLLVPPGAQASDHTAH